MYSVVYVYSGFQASVEFRFKPRRISPTNPTWHPLRIKFPTEISNIPNNSFSIKSPMKSDITTLKRLTRDPFVVITRFMRAYTNPTWLE